MTAGYVALGVVAALAATWVLTRPASWAAWTRRDPGPWRGPTRRDTDEGGAS